MITQEDLRNGADPAVALKYKQNVSAEPMMEQAAAQQLAGASIVDETAPSARPMGNQAINSNKGVAGAKPGDYIIRKDGSTYVLTAGDIAWAQKKISAATQPSVNTGMPKEPSVNTDTSVVEESKEDKPKNTETPDAMKGDARYQAKADDPKASSSKPSLDVPSVTKGIKDREAAKAKESESRKTGGSAARRELERRRKAGEGTKFPASKAGMPSNLEWMIGPDGSYMPMNR